MHARVDAGEHAGLRRQRPRALDLRPSKTRGIRRKRIVMGGQHVRLQVVDVNLVRPKRVAHPNVDVLEGLLRGRRGRQARHRQPRFGPRDAAAAGNQVDTNCLPGERRQIPRAIHEFCRSRAFKKDSRRATIADHANLRGHVWLARAVGKRKAALRGNLNVVRKARCLGKC